MLPWVKAEYKEHGPCMVPWRMNEGWNGLSPTGLTLIFEGVNGNSSGFDMTTGVTLNRYR